MKVVPELPLLWERIRSLKLSEMNLKLPRQTVSPREKPLYVRDSMSEATVSTDEGTIEMFRGKAHFKSPFLVHQLSVFSTLARTRWSRSRVPVLRWSCELQST
jgi:hypothetical protein